MSLQCRPHMEPSGVPCIRPPMPPRQKRLRLPVMTVNGMEPDAKGNVVVDPPDLAELEGRVDGLDDAVREENHRAVRAEEELGARITAEASRAQTAERALRADVSSAQTAIADRYTKSEVDTKIAGVQTFGKVVVPTLPDLADADDKTIYLVPRADSEAPDLCDEYVVVEEAGVRRWERIGAKAVDLTLDNTVTRTSANGVKSSGIWSMLWGALTAALPTGFSSLYDWCVAQLAGKADKTITVVPAHGLPADCYPVVYVKDGTTHTITGDADIREYGPRYYALYDSDATAWVCYFAKSTGEYFADAGAVSVTFNGTAPVQNTWPVLTSAAVTSSVVYDKDIVAPSTAPAASGKAADAKATGDALAGKASKSDATLTPIYSHSFSEWHFDGDPPMNPSFHYYVSYSDGWWTLLMTNGIVIEVVDSASGSEDAVSIHFDNASIEATRTRTDRIIGYQLGSQTDKPLASADPLIFAQYYPDGNVKSSAEFTPGIKYDAPDTTNRTITVKPFCNTGTAANDNSDLEGRVVIPPFVDAQGNPYISDDGTRYKVVGVGDFDGWLNPNVNLTAVVVPNTVTNNIGVSAFNYCTALTSVSPLAATGIGDNAFANCESLSSVSLPAATTIGDEAFAYCESLSSVDFGDTPRAAVPSLGIGAFGGVPPSCKIIVPYTQYNAWITADGWSALPQEFVRHAEKADKPATFTAGNLAALDATGNPTDSGVKASDKLDSASAAPAFSTDSSTQYAVGAHVTYNGKLYVCTTATTGGTWDASKWTADTMTDPDAVLDITSQNQLRVVTKDGTLLWAQGYDLASTSSATLACDAVNNFTFADGATTQAFTLPTAPTGKVGDFGLDIDNFANASAATISFSNVANNTASVIIPKGENLNDMLAIAAGELARFYITLSTFRINKLPTWHIVKQVVENGGAQS